MAQYFNYTGAGGSYNGTGLPTSTIITAAEKVVCLTPVPDNRQPIQNGVLVTANVCFGVSTTAIATFLCRQSTLGTNTAVTGAVLTNGGNTGTGTYTVVLGTQAGTVVSGGTNIGPYVFTWVDYTGTQPLPVYQLTAITASGTATITSAFITATPLGV